MRFELAKWCVLYDPTPLPTAGAFDFERVPVLTPALELLSLDHAVHENPGADGSYVARPTQLCVFRSTRHRWAVWRLDEVSIALMERFRAGRETVTEAVRAELAARDQPITPAFIERLAGLLAELIERGAILGSRS
jgi:hypothetical protein